MIFPNC